MLDKCKHCGKPNIIESGWNYRGGKKAAKRWRCKSCGRISIDPVDTITEENNEPKSK